MGKLRDHIRQKLEGQATRQAHRDAARSWARKKRLLDQARYEGSLDEIYAARGFLEGVEAEWVEEKVYGMTILAVETGLRLAYRPDGTLDRSKRTRRELCGEHPTMFPGESYKLSFSPESAFPLRDGRA